MSDENGDIPLLAEARSGGQAALGRLAVLVRERLYPLVLRMTLDRDATEDILQETLLTMLRRLASLHDNERFWPWIYRIAWNKVQDRRRDRRLHSLAQAGLLRRQGEDRGLDDADLLDAQVRAETLQQISIAMVRLTRRQRDILRLRCYDDLSYADIAGRTRTTPEYARIRFHRAKKSLQKCLAYCG